MSIVRRFVSLCSWCIALTLSPSVFAEDEARRHWSFQPVKEVSLPTVANVEWLRTPVDAFVLTALEQRRWQPAPSASRSEWIRRVYFDLINWRRNAYGAWVIRTKRKRPGDATGNIVKLDDPTTEGRKRKS